jgi:hypothetical protein
MNDISQKETLTWKRKRKRWKKKRKRKKRDVVVAVAVFAAAIVADGLLFDVVAAASVFRVTRDDAIRKDIYEEPFTTLIKYLRTILLRSDPSAVSCRDFICYYLLIAALKVSYTIVEPSMQADANLQHLIASFPVQAASSLG